MDVHEGLEVLCGDGLGKIRKIAYSPTSTNIIHWFQVDTYDNNCSSIWSAVKFPDANNQFILTYDEYIAIEPTQSVIKNWYRRKLAQYSRFKTKLTTAINSMRND